MNRFGALLVAWGLSAAAAAAASPDPKDLAVPPEELSKAKALVRKLGSESYRDREEAQEQLAGMGRLAMPALLEAVNADPSSEVRFRCARLLPRAEAADLQARIDSFLSDADLKFDHHLPAWKLYRKEVGDDKAARDLYVELIKGQSNLEILQAIDRSPEAGGRAISDRRAALYHQINPNMFGRRGPDTTPPRQPTLPDITALLFGEVVVPSKDIPRAGLFFMVVTSPMILQQTQAAVNAINNPSSTPFAAPFRTVLVRWLDTRTAEEDLTYAVNVAAQFASLKETTPLLRRAIATDGVQGYAKGQALSVLVQRNGKEEAGFLKSLFKNDTQVTQVWLGNNGMGGNVIASLQLRDVALGLLVVQSGQKLQDYGFEFPPGINPNQVQNFGYGSYAFTAEEKREAAFSKFAEWEAKAKPEPKKDEKK